MTNINTLKQYINFEFSTGCYTGNDYISFQTKYINFLKTICRNNNWKLIKVNKNHYCFSSFIKGGMENRCVYISISDVIYLKPIGDTPIQGTLQWLNPDQVITIDNNGQSFPVKFIPFSEEDNLNYNFEGNITLKINIKKDILNVSGDYQSVNPIEDGKLEPMPKYMEYLGKWMEEGMKTTAPNYTANIQIDYTDTSTNFNLTGQFNNKYSDTSSYTSFTTNTTLTDGINNFTISGANNNFTITKNGESSDFIINKEIDESIIFIALLIDAPNNLVNGDTVNYYTAQDDETLKIKVEDQKNEGFTTVYFVFDNQGSLIGYKVSFETTDKTACYSFQVKLN